MSYRVLTEYYTYTYSVPFSILSLLLKLGKLAPIVDGCVEFPDEKDNESNDDNASYSYQDDGQNVDGFRTNCKKKSP